MKMTRTKIAILLIIFTSLVTLIGLKLSTLKNRDIRVYNVNGVKYECEYDSYGNLVNCQKAVK